MIYIKYYLDVLAKGVIIYFLQKCSVALQNVIGYVRTRPGKFEALVGMSMTNSRPDDSMTI